MDRKCNRQGDCKGNHDLKLEETDMGRGDPRLMGLQAVPWQCCNASRNTGLTRVMQNGNLLKFLLPHRKWAWPQCQGVSKYGAEYYLLSIGSFFVLIIQETRRAPGIEELIGWSSAAGGWFLPIPGTRTWNTAFGRDGSRDDQWGVQEAVCTGPCNTT